MVNETVPTTVSGTEIEIGPPTRNYTFADPHTEFAFWLIWIAIGVILLGWVIDMAIDEYGKDKR